MLISSNEIAGLRQILAAALRRGAGAQKILELLERAIAGVYRPRGGFNTRDLAPTADDINHNISTFFDPAIQPPPDPSSYLHLVGHIAMFDGVALEAKCRYCPIRNSVIGLCREHSKNVGTEVTDLQSVENICTALFESQDHPLTKVCFGCDATVVAIAPYGRENHYNPTPLIASPSDKTEKGGKLAKWMQTLIDCWKDNSNGEQANGELWALGSDGDSVFRAAKHELCMNTDIDLASLLGRLLCPLVGLNCHTGPTGIVGTCDPKHIIKCMFQAL